MRKTSMWAQLRAAALAGAALLAAALAGAAAAQAPAPSQAQSTTRSPSPTACPPPLEAAGRAAPADRGLLWRITRDGHSSYLFGTLHVGKPAWREFGPRTAAAWRASDLLALELDPTDPEVGAALAVDAAPAQPLPQALQERLAQAVARACLPAAALASLHPVLQATTLTVLDARWLGLDPSQALEMQLAERAHHASRRIVSLETVALQKATLVPAAPDEVLALVEQSLAQLEDLTSRRVLARLAAAWESGDLATLEDYERWCECAASDDERAFLRRLNDERNPHLAERIAALHDEGRRVFAAVGALHMTGVQALPTLMAARGFRVERVKFSR